MSEYAFPLTPGEAILVLRRRKGWTQAQLAREAGCSRGFVSCAERDDEGLWIWNYRPLFEALGCFFPVRAAQNAVGEL